MVWFVLFLFISADVSVTSRKRNPLVNMNIEWTDQMVSDFKKYEEDAKAVFPVCGLYNITTVAVSINTPVKCLVYRKISVISPGLIQLRKRFWVGL